MTTAMAAMAMADTGNISHMVATVILRTTMATMTTATAAMAMADTGNISHMEAT